MPNGLVKFFNAAKGFGFITGDEGGKDIFVPMSSVTASGMAGLTQGQRVSFETQPDARGPKAVNLKLIANAPPPPAPVVRQAPMARAPAPAKLTLYLDPDCDKAQMVLEDLRAAGVTPHMVNYITAPPSREELQNLSLLLRAAGQHLVRKYDPLFQDLRLDDRFISDAEVWGGVFENPSLINGPVLAGGGRAAVCRAEGAVDAFLAILSGKAVPQPAAPKALQAAPIKQAQAALPKAEPAPLKAAKASASVEHPVAAKPKAGPKPNSKPKPIKTAAPAPKKKATAKAAAKPALKKPAAKITPKLATKKAKPKAR